MVELGPSVLLIGLLSVFVTLAIPVVIVWLIVVLIRNSAVGLRDATTLPQSNCATGTLGAR